MKAFLLHQDTDFDLEGALPPGHEALIQDLELTTLIATMAAGDQFVFEVVQRVLLLSLRDPDAIVYRQQILADCLREPAVVRDLYALAGEALKAERSIWRGLGTGYPRTILSTAVQKMELFVGSLRGLLEAAETHGEKFTSRGWTRFFTMLQEELDAPYFELVESQLKALQFKGGMLMSTRLGAGNKGAAYTLRWPRTQSLLGRVFDRSGYSFTIPERDDSGFRALGDLEDKAANPAANALSQAVDHVHSFFVMLRVEIGFYVGALNLSERLGELGEPTTLPVAIGSGERVLAGRGLYDVSLRLTTPEPVVGNDVNADGKSLVMITGANQGGKSTFLRSIGQAQLMTQSGMFVGAESLQVNICDAIFTHYKREEDRAMESGKLDEELARMGEIADHITPGSMLLCNESFASTNEREGSQIAREVVTALLESGVKVLFVTHMFDLANSFHRQGLDTALFLRAERGTDGARPFRISEGEPLPTSYGEDSYRKVFGRGIHGAPTAVPERGRGS